MKIIITESQYITITEDIEKERYKKLVSELLKTLFGELTIKNENDGGGKTYIHIIYDQYGEDIARIFLGDHANRGCKKDLTLTQETSERLEGYIPYYRHKIFSKVLIEYIYDKFKIKCDCIQYDYNFEREMRYSDDEDDDEEEYEYLDYDTRKYNIKKKKKIKESIEGSNVVEQLLELENIRVYYGYKNRIYNRDGEQFDDAYVSFELPDGYKYERTVRFKTIKNKVIGVYKHGDFAGVVEGFKYVPEEIVNDYFIEKLKTHLENVLPFEYRKDNDSFIP